MLVTSWKMTFTPLTSDSLVPSIVAVDTSIVSSSMSRSRVVSFSPFLAAVLIHSSVEMLSAKVKSRSSSCFVRRTSFTVMVASYPFSLGTSVT